MGAQSDFLDVMKSRGFVFQETAGLDGLFKSRPVTGYIGFDATADSLHVGSLVQIMSLRWLQKTGHRPIVVLGGGTTKIGDPSGKTETRKLLDDETIAKNTAGIRKVFDRFLKFGSGPTDALMLNNLEWLEPLSYIPFLRDIGQHFTVNQLLTLELVKKRLADEKPLSFLEFNYVIVQSFDFLEIYRRTGCRLQMGGSDQWGNIVKGIELTRKVADADVFGLTTPIIENTDGTKMGKTADGAVWLNAERVSSWDYWQYWRNTADADVGRFLKLFTELPLTEIARLEALKGGEINEAKKILATEATRMAHGDAAAKYAEETAKKTFEEGVVSENLPSIDVARSELLYGVSFADLLVRVGLVATKAEARRQIEQGGARLNETPIGDIQRLVRGSDFSADGTARLTVGRKRHAIAKVISNAGEVVTFDQLLHALPEGPYSGPDLLRDASVDLVVQENPRFIAPTLSLVPSLSAALAESRLAVISAAGAVGKSTLAREIARRRGGLLVDLASRDVVGQGSFVNYLVESFGAEHLSEVLAAIAQGKMLVVVDALDEARMKANSGGFTAFLRGILAIAQKSSRISIVLAGRSVVAEETWLEAAEQGLATALLRINNFSRDEGNAYIERRILSLGGPAAMALETHRAAFEDQRDAMIEQLSSAMTGEREKQQFLGYAPVLDALALRIADDPNFSRATEDLAAESGKLETPASFLRKICEDILDRERKEKVLHHIRVPLQPIADSVKWRGWETLYSVDEQVGRLAAKVIGRHWPGRSDLPPVVQAKYEEQVSTFVDQHPFLKEPKTIANAVFEAYVFAKALVHGSGGMRQAVEEFLAAQRASTSRLLADFYFALARTDDVTILEIPPAHVGIVLESALAAEDADTHVDISLEGETSDDSASPVELDGEITICTHPDDEEPFARPISFKVRAESNTRFVFTGRLRGAFISIPHDVSLVGPTGEFQIGPSVALRCRTLSISASSLLVRSARPAPSRLTDENSEVVLSADRYVGPFASVPDVKGSLTVDWPDANQHPWNKWAEKVPAQLADDPRLAIAFRRFRKIAMTLRSHGKGSLARTERKVTNERTLGGVLGEVLLKRLVSDGILKLRDGYYHWVPERAAHHVGVSWADLRAGRTTDTLVRYLRKFVEANPALFQ